MQAARRRSQHGASQARVAKLDWVNKEHIKLALRTPHGRAEVVHLLRDMCTAQLEAGPSASAAAASCAHEAARERRVQEAVLAASDERLLAILELMQAREKNRLRALTVNVV